MGVINESMKNNANLLPPRRGNGAALTVDTTARVYDLRALAFNGQAYKANVDEALFLDLQNDGTNPIYYYFSSSNTVDLNEATVTAAGGTLALANAVPKVLRAAQDAPVEIERDIDQFLIVKSTGGTSTLRIFPSSKSTPQVQ